MNFLRQHWFDVGYALALLVTGFLFLPTLDPIALVLWVSLISLFLHQFEEYRFPGTFPGMINRVMFSSKQPDRYPLNTNTALIINLLVGWFFYFLAAAFGENALWLGIATILVSAGNFIAHTFLFNIKAKTPYNPGMFTSVFLFLPIVVWFFILVIRYDLASPIDWTLGIVLGIALNYIGILKLIDWLKDENTEYIFPERFIPTTVKDTTKEAL